MCAWVQKLPDSDSCKHCMRNTYGHKKDQATAFQGLHEGTNTPLAWLRGRGVLPFSKAGSTYMLGDWQDAITSISDAYHVSSITLGSM